MDLERTTPRAIFWAALLLAFGTQCALFGGEAIQFSNRKPVGKTPQRSQLTKEMEQASPGRASNLGTDLVAPDFSLPVVDPKEEKRQKQAAFEKKNWMLVNGQVDEDREVDEAFGIRSEEEFEKEGEQEGSWLSPLRDDRSRSQDSSSRGPAQTRAGAAQRFAPNRSSQGNESDSSSLSAGLGQGASLASELRIRSSLAPGGSAAPTIGESAFKNLLSGGSGDQGRGTRGPLSGLGLGPSRGSGLGFDSMAPPQSPLAPPRSAPASSGFYEPSARSQGGFPADSSFWRARNQAGDSLGSPGFGDSLLPRSDNFNSPAAPPQQIDQRRSFREFEKPRFPGQ